MAANQVYDDFENNLHRWDAAKELLDRIASDIEAGRDPWDDRWAPPAGEVDRLIDKWLRSDMVVCQAGSSLACPGHEQCGRRCTAKYWRQHGEDVAASMASLGRLLGEDEETWRTVGRVHDIDYALHPHHSPDVASQVSHPVGLANELHQLGAAPAVVLAILSHAPHLRLRPASPLAWALLACDEHATMTGYANGGLGTNPSYPDRLKDLAAGLHSASSAIRGGFRRPDMQDRANLGLSELLTYQQGKATRFERAGFARRIDWPAAEEAARQGTAAP